MSLDSLAAPPEQVRAELALDMRRGGYVYDELDRSRRYFNKYLVLSRPGLVSRAARLLAALLPAECERIGVTNIPGTVLGAAIAQESGLPLLLALDRKDDDLHFGGESFSGVRAVLLEDIVDTGRRALLGTEALSTLGAEVLMVICLLDRQAGGAGRLAKSGFTLKALFTEADLLAG